MPRLFANVRILRVLVGLFIYSLSTSLQLLYYELRFNQWLVVLKKVMYIIL